MSAIKESEYEAQKALRDFYHNLPDKHKWKPSGPNPIKATVKQMEQYLKQHTIPNISNWGKSKDDIGDRDVFFYSGQYLGYHLADGGGGYVHFRDILKPAPHVGSTGWRTHPRILNAWAHTYATWDITDLVLNIQSNHFLNWLNENPFEVKQ